MANQSGPESCVVYREVQGEALTGETGGPAIEPRNQESGMPMLLCEAEGNMEYGVTRQSYSDPARSKTLSTLGSLMHGNWEISSVPAAQAMGGVGKVNNRNPIVNAGEKSDTPVVPEKLSNKVRPLGCTAEMVEERGVTKGNADKPPALRTQGRTKCASTGLEGIREVARRDKKVRFTALLHHITPQLLKESFYDLRKDAAVGVDGVTWRDYEQGLSERLNILHREIHTGAYRANPSRRVYIPKADG